MCYETEVIVLESNNDWPKKVCSYCTFRGTTACHRGRALKEDNFVPYPALNTAYLYLKCVIFTLKVLI